MPTEAEIEDLGLDLHTPEDLVRDVKMTSKMTVAQVRNKQKANAVSHISRQVQVAALF